MTAEYRYQLSIQTPPEVLIRFAKAGDRALASLSQPTDELYLQATHINNEAPTAKHQRQILFFEQPPINYELAVSRSMNTKPATYLHKQDLEWAEQKFMDKFREFPIPKSVAEKIQPKNQAEFVRIGRNCQSAKDAIVDGWTNEPKRRTGESYHIHPLRVFLRGLATMDNVKPEERSVFHVSLLSRILHDAKEDLSKFVIKKTALDGTYVIKFANKTRPDYYLELSESEKRLLDLQLDALTIPPNVKVIKERTEKTQKQIAHLLQYVDEIYNSPDGGAYAAYQTLQIKLEDRLDNLLTYYDSKNNKTDKKNTKENLFDKCSETIMFFREVEKKASLYSSEAGKEDYIQAQKNKYESVVRLCFYILEGASYDDIVQYGDTTEIGIANAKKFTIPFRRDAAVERYVDPAQRANWTQSVY